MDKLNYDILTQRAYQKIAGSMSCFCDNQLICENYERCSGCPIIQSYTHIFEIYNNMTQDVQEILTHKM